MRHSMLIASLAAASGGLVVGALWFYSELGSGTGGRNTSPTVSDAAAPPVEAEPEPSAIHTRQLQASLLDSGRLAAIEERLSNLEEGGDHEREGGSVEQDEGAPAEPQLSAEQQIETIDRTLAHEAYDSQWAPAMTDRISATLASETLPGTVAEEVECHSTFCRLSVSHDDRESQMRFRQLPSLLGEVVAGWNVNSPDGEVKTVAYVVRKGQDLSEHPVAVMAGRGAATQPL